MRLLTLVLVALSACGTPGPQGPEGEQGPAGPPGPGGGGGTVVFANPEGALNEHYILNGASFVFDLAEPPTSATVLYLDLSACVSSASQPGAIVTFRTAVSTFGIDIASETSCSSQHAAEAASGKQIWMPSSGPHQITAQVQPASGTAPPAQAQVRVLGWIAP